MQYYIHWNGGRPWQVEVDPNRHVMLRCDTDGYEANAVSLVYDHVFIPDDSAWPPQPDEEPAYRDARGNTILVCTAPLEYVWIGRHLERFTTPTPIRHFYSPVGNSDVPYPYAVTDDEVFLLLERVAFRRDAWPVLATPGNRVSADPQNVYRSPVEHYDPYHFYYGQPRRPRGHRLAAPFRHVDAEVFVRHPDM